MSSATDDGDRDISRDDVRRLVPLYFRQLTEGCGQRDDSCREGCCALNGGAMSPNHAAARAIELAVSQGFSGLCTPNAPARDLDVDMTEDTPVGEAPVDTHDNDNDTAMRMDTDGNVNDRDSGDAHSAQLADNEDPGTAQAMDTDSPDKEGVSKSDGVPVSAMAVDNDDNDDDDQIADEPVTPQTPSVDTALRSALPLERTNKAHFDAMMDQYLATGELKTGDAFNMNRFLYETFGPPGFEMLMTTFASCEMSSNIGESGEPQPKPRLSHRVDLPKLRAFYEMCTERAIDGTRDRLFEAVKDLLKMEMVRLPATTYNETARLRVFILLFELPILRDMESQEVVLPLLCTCVKKLSPKQRKVIVDWWAAEQGDSLKSKLEVLQQFILLKIVGGAESDDEDTDRYVINHDTAVLDALVVVKMIHTANAARPLTDQLDATAFNNDGVNEYFKVIRDFEVWKATEFRELGLEPDIPRHAFSFCDDYPFVLSLPVKAKIMHFEHRFRHDVAQRAHVSRNLLSILTGQEDANFVISVRRNSLIRDALREISGNVIRNPEVIRQPMRVNFVGEEGLDYGGVRAEFFLLIIKELFDPIYGMFQYFEDTRYHWFTRRSLEDPQEYYLLGLLLGLALYNNTILDLHFPTAIYKKLLGASVTIDDLAQFNPELAHGLQQLLAYDGDDVEDVFSVNFCVEYDAFGAKMVDDLCENGRNIPVTSSNKQDYVDKYVDYILNTSIEKTFFAFKDGFMSTTKGVDSMALFTAPELEQLICGTQDLDFEILRRVTKYDGFDKGADTPVIQWFWEFVGTFSDEDKKKLLLFSTGCDRVPVGGLQKFKFCICKQGSDSDQLPTSHTCFNVLMLPEYSNKEKLVRLLKLAMENSEGFGMI